MYISLVSPLPSDLEPLFRPPLLHDRVTEIPNANFSLDWSPRPLLLPWCLNQVHTLTHVVVVLASAHTFRAGQLVVSLPPSSYGRTWALIQRPPSLGLSPLPKLCRLTRTRSAPTPWDLTSLPLPRTTSVPIRRSKHSLAPSIYRTLPPASCSPAFSDPPPTNSGPCSEPKRAFPNPPPHIPSAKRRLLPGT